MTPHKFATSVKSAAAVAEEPWVETVYRRAFPKLDHTTIMRADGWAQRAGIDRLLILGYGKTLSVEEKFRFKDYGDFLLERWSNGERRTPGWMQQDLACDYLAYIVIPARCLWLIPWVDLRRAWLKHGKEWIRRYPAPPVPNEHYSTINVAVPRPVLFKALLEGMAFTWTEAEEEGLSALPKSEQLQFDF